MAITFLAIWFQWLPPSLYDSPCEGANKTFHATYIHSKLMIVDDRFLTISSAMSSLPP